MPSCCSSIGSAPIETRGQAPACLGPGDAGGRIPLENSMEPARFEALVDRLEALTRAVLALNPDDSVTDSIEEHWAAIIKTGGPDLDAFIMLQAELSTALALEVRRLRQEAEHRRLPEHAP